MPFVSRIIRSPWLARVPAADALRCIPFRCEALIICEACREWKRRCLSCGPLLRYPDYARASPLADVPCHPAKARERNGENSRRAGAAGIAEFRQGCGGLLRRARRRGVAQARRAHRVSSAEAPRQSSPRDAEAHWPKSEGAIADSRAPRHGV